MFRQILEGKMKRSTWMRIIAIVVLAVLAAVDAIVVFVPLVALAGIVILLFKPKWFRTFINDLYD